MTDGTTLKDYTTEAPIVLKYQVSIFLNFLCVFFYVHCDVQKICLCFFYFASISGRITLHNH